MRTVKTCLQEMYMVLNYSYLHKNADFSEKLPILIDLPNPIFLFFYLSFEHHETNL